MAGDVLFNLRSALDHLVYAVATRAGVSGDKTSFPIFLDPRAYATRAPQIIGDLPAQAQASIQWLQPYHSANPPHHPLWLFHELNRIDKHRLLNVVQTVTHRSDLTVQSAEGVPMTVMGAMDSMVRFRLAELLEEKDWTAYRLAQETELTVPAAYRLADPDRPVQRLDMATLDTLCRVLKVQPGELLEWVPGKGRRG